jgi:hypothetical protein
MVPCSVGNRCIGETSRKTFLSGKYKYKTIDGKKKSNPTDAYQVTPQARNFNVVHSSIHIIGVRV